MSDHTLNYDPYNFNNGVVPAPGLVWSGVSWSFPTHGPDYGDTMYAILDETNIPENIKESIKDDICLKCGKKNCPYIQKDPGYKKLQDAIKNKDKKAIRGVYMTNFAQFNGATLGVRNSALEKEKEAKQKAEAELKTGIRMTTDFYEQVSNELGERAQRIAKRLADMSVSPNVFGVDDAIDTFEKFGHKFGTVFTDADRTALANALESVDKNELAEKFKLFGKAFGAYGIYDDVSGLYNEFSKSLENDNWRPFFVKAAQVAGSRGIGLLTAFTFAFLASNPLTLPVYALLTALAGASLDTGVIEDILAMLNI